MTFTTDTHAAIYSDGQIARRGDVLIGADGASYDFLSVGREANSRRPATVYVRATERREVPATFVGLSVAAKEDLPGYAVVVPGRATVYLHTEEEAEAVYGDLLQEFPNVLIRVEDRFAA